MDIQYRRLGNLCRVFAAIAAVSVATLSSAQSLEGQVVRVTLVSGDVVTGVLASQTADGVVIDHPTLGQLTISADQVGSVDAAPAESDAADAEAVEAAPEGEAAEPLVEVDEAPAWELRFALGANGANGNTERNAVTIGLDAARESKVDRLDLNLLYFYADEDKSKTDNYLYTRARYGWRAHEAAIWGAYGESTYEFDDFKDWTDRATFFGGLWYAFIDDGDDERLVGRVGGGGTQRWGSADDSWDSQIQFAVDYRKKFNDRVNFVSSAQWLPALDDFSDSRLRGTADLFVKLNEEGDWLLKLGIIDEYDSTPTGDDDHNDFWYTASIVMVF